MDPRPHGREASATTAPLVPTERNGHSGVTPEECPLCAPLLYVMADMASVLREDERI